MADRHTGRETLIDIDRQTGRETLIDIDRQTGRQAGRLTDR